MNRSRGSRLLVGLMLLVIILLAGTPAQAQIFAESFDSAWTNPASLLTGGQPWSGIGTGNSEWHRNDYLTGWSNGSGAYSPTGALSTAHSARWHTTTAGTIPGSLITPRIDFSSFSGNKRVTFYSINTSGTDVMRVYLSTDGGSSYGPALATIGVSAAWTQYSVALGTTTSSTVKIKFETTGDYGNTDFGLDEMVVEGYTPLTGIKMVGSGGEYATLTAAINALNSTGVSAPGVTFNVTAGSVFTEDVPAIAAGIGSSASAPVVFQKSGAGANPVIKPTGTAGTADFGFGIAGADYITVDGIDITENSGSAVEYGYLIKNANSTDGATNITIKNATITLNRANTSSYGVVQTSSGSIGSGTAASSSAGANSLNRYQNIVVANSYNGMAMMCDSGTFPDTGNEIGTVDGGVTQFGGSVAGDSLGMGSSTCYGLRLGTQSGLKVSNVIVRNAKVTSSINLYGIWLDNSSNGTYAAGEISNCTVNGLFSSSTSSSSVIYGIRADIGSGNTCKVFNNDIYGITPTLVTVATTAQVLRALAANAGSNSGTVSGTVNAYYNSVHIGSGLINLLGSSVAFYMAGGTVNLANNIFSNVTAAQTTAKHYGAFVSSGTVSSSSNNVIWTPNTNGMIGFRNIDCTTLDIFAAAMSATAPVDGAEAGSANADPSFVSPSNLNFAGNTPAALSGMPVIGITTDITGAARSTTRPTIGAHETANGLDDRSAPILSNVVITSGAMPTVSVELTDNSAASNPAVVELWYRQVSQGYYVGVDADVKPLGSMNGTYMWNASLASVPFGGTYEFYIVARDGTGAGTNLSASPIWKTSFPVVGGFANVDPPNYGANPASFANVRTFTKASLFLAGGTYEVGTDQPALKNLSDVAAQLNGATLLGDVTYELNSSYDGTTGENMPIKVNEFTTTGGTWSVTIRVKSGVSTRTTRGSASTILRLIGVDRLLMDGRSGGTGNVAGWVLENLNGSVIEMSTTDGEKGCSGDEVRYCKLIGRSGYGVHIFGDVSVGTPGNTIIDHNEILGCDWGIALSGGLLYPAIANTVSNNIIGPAQWGVDRISRAGIVLDNQTNAVVTGNEVRCVGVLAADNYMNWDCVGIGLGSYSWPLGTSSITNCIVSENTIHDIIQERTYSALGIQVGSTSTPSGNRVANNLVYSIRANGTNGNQGVGIGVARCDRDTLIYNSINIAGDQDPVGSASATFPTAGICVGSVNARNIILANNAVSIDVSSNSSSLHHYAILLPTSTFSFGSGYADHNDWYANAASAQVSLGGLGTAPPFIDVATLSAWRLVFMPMQDLASLSTLPPFVSGTDLHLNSASPSELEEHGAAFAAIAKDCDGEQRKQANPDIGADEVARDAGSLRLIEPVVGGEYPVNTVLSPHGVVINNTSRSVADIVARLRIATIVGVVVYEESLLTAAVPPAGQADVLFPQVSSLASGQFSAELIVRSAGDRVSSNDTLRVVFKMLGGLQGRHGVCTSCEYRTLGEAITAATANGVTGPVEFTLQDSLYAASTGETFPIVVSAIPGADSASTVTIRPADGVRTVIRGASASATLVLSGTSWIVLDGASPIAPNDRCMTIKNESTTIGSAAIWIQSLAADSGTSHVVIRNINCSTAVDQMQSFTTCFGIVSCGPIIGLTSDGAGNDHNVIDNVYVTQARWGIYLRGCASQLNVDNRISHCIIGPSAFGSEQISKAGVVLQYQALARVEANDIRFVGCTKSQLIGGTSHIGVALGVNSWPVTLLTRDSACVITRNTIHDIVDEKGMSAIAVLEGVAGTQSRNIVENNMIWNIRANGIGQHRTIGIGLAAGDNGIVAFNSVSLTGDMDPVGVAPAGQGAVGVLVASDLVVNCRIHNNILHLDMTSDTDSLRHSCIEVMSNNYRWGGGASNNNDLAANGALSHNIVGSVGAAWPSLRCVDVDSWRGAFVPGQDSASLGDVPTFVSPVDLHLNLLVPTALEGAGVGVSEVVTDYDNELRSVSAPDIGADEGAFQLPISAVRVESDSAFRHPEQEWVSVHPIQARIRVTCSLRRRADVRMRLYDAKGRLVGSLLKERQQPGIHNYELPVGGLVRGVYLCAVESGVIRASYRVLLLR